MAAAEEAFVKAQATVEAARPAAASITVAELQAAQGRLEAAGDDKDARKAAQGGCCRELEKPGKDLEKAQSTLSKASDGRGSAASALATSEAKVETVLATLSVARREVDVVEGEAARRRPADTLVSLTEPPSVDGVEDSLPPAVAQRREFHPHESPWTMIVPLIVLSLGAIFAGVINLPFGRNTRLLERWLEPSLFGETSDRNASRAASIASRWRVVGAIPAAQPVPTCDPERPGVVRRQCRLRLSGCASHAPERRVPDRPPPAAAIVAASRPQRSRPSRLPRPGRSSELTSAEFRGVERRMPHDVDRRIQRIR